MLKMQPLINGKYTFEDIYDIEDLTYVLQKYSKAVGYPVGLVEQQTNRIILTTGHVKLCKAFHRVNPESEKVCIASNMQLQSQLKKGENYAIHHCDHGLVDGATPIIIKGVHIANLYIGQVFFESPKKHFFKSLAQKYGYDKREYLNTLKDVKVVNEEDFRKNLKFLAELAMLLAEDGLNKLNSMEKERIIKGLITICPICKKIHTNDGGWAKIEAYIEENSLADTRYYYCPDCFESSKAQSDTIKDEIPE
jgi:ligand-binding sensor protein